MLLLLLLLLLSTSAFRLQMFGLKEASIEREKIKQTEREIKRLKEARGMT